WKEGLVYQLFVDRFARGEDWQRRFFDARGDGRLGTKRLLQPDWHDVPFMCKDDRGWVVRWPFFGGTLEGVREKLSYIRSLGVTVIYMNPVFEAASNHKYDTGDYMKIDPGYGDEDAFRRLAEEAAEHGISIVLDGVFSHTGADSVYFNRYGNYPSLGAWQSEDSPYRGWYRFNQDPEGYECWWGVADLPNVEESDSGYQEYIWGGDDSVIRHWLRAGARGWRLDVADELPDSFIASLKTAIKETKGDGLLMGEVWEDASNKRSYGEMREYLLGRELDATMNYPFRDWCIDFALNRIGPPELHARVMNIYENYPRERFVSCMNLVGSHDRERILSVLGGLPDEQAMSDWQRQSWRLGTEARGLAKRRLKLLSLWQMAFPGVPSIYYGDEAGVEGLSDPHNRATFPWGREDGDLVGWYRMIGNLRAEYSVLRDGGFESCGGYSHMYAFSRFSGGERALIFINASAEHSEDAEIELADGENVFVELLSGEALEPDGADGPLRLSVGPLECRAVYIRKTDPALLPMKKLGRAAGLLCHVTSLPSDIGCGDMGQVAYDFCGYLASGGQRIWQILPLNPAGAGDSPYSGCSAFAGNELLIDCGAFMKSGLISEQDMPKRNLTAQALQSIMGGGVQSRADFARARAAKQPVFEKAYAAFNENSADFRDFCARNEYWLADYCLYRAIREYFGGKPWQEWPQDIRDREPAALDEYRERLSRAAGLHRFLQYEFERQWNALKAHANGLGVSILGDLPIYVSADSCDAWANRSLFALDGAGRARKTGGVPPDAFSEDGQNWGNPVFDWPANRSQGYEWWIRRLGRNLALCDFLRLDHFRGFEAYWEIPAGSATAVSGFWAKGPGKELFEAAEAALGPLPMLAEDLGYLTPNVDDLKNTFAWPGMKVYQFHADSMGLKDPARPDEAGDSDGGDGGVKDAEGAEGAEDAEDAGRVSLQAYYTGTHDNDTLAGWLAGAEGAGGADGEASAPLDQEGIRARCSEIIESLYGSDAMWVILPLQDAWFLDSSARMNIPGTVGGNWVWAAGKDGFTGASSLYLRGLAEKYKRL
ncbi:MAG: 4-alpha-glucanotransferase, partial [Clostridiales Family XIII bacterium]|nr:4-alpha-glucanotransferase [Clostridiales Family XIII bacterium]